MGATVELTSTDVGASTEGASTEGASTEGASTEEPQELEREVEGIRENISGIVGELDRRRHDLLDWRLQLRKHAAVLAALTAGWLLAVGVTMAIGASRRKRRNRPLAKARRLREALSRMVAHPELVAQPHPGIGRKLLAAAASATAGALTKAAISELIKSLESDDATIRVIKS